MLVVRIEMSDDKGPMSEWCSPLRNALNDLWSDDRDSYPPLETALRYSGILFGARGGYRCGVDAGAIDFHERACEAGLRHWFGTDLGRYWMDDEDGPTDEGLAVAGMLRSYGAQVVLLHVARGEHVFEGKRCSHYVECNNCSHQVVYHAPASVELARIDMPAGNDWTLDAARMLGVSLGTSRLAA
jgi:hypothetical protein